MWKYLEQVSFPMSEAEYMAQLDAVAELLTQWGLVSTVRDGIQRSSSRGPGYTGGGGARAVSCLRLASEGCRVMALLPASMCVCTSWTSLVRVLNSH